MYVLTSNEVNYLILLDYYYEGNELHIMKSKLYSMKHKYILWNIQIIIKQMDETFI